MHITKVELENIKSHAHAELRFERGTTAITGANGAGKTTIIEAVAWTLFNLLDYKKDDFAMRGAKNKGVARVTFESSLDEREYTVYRDTANGYYVYDPRLKARIAEKREEVTRFLRQHLGVEAGTDLESLFRCAIGVPQGTFTADFLKTPAERKPIFDKLLKVEEYREGAEKLRETVNFLKTKTIVVREKIARAEGELSRLDAVESDYRNSAAQVEGLSENLEKLNTEVTGKREMVKQFDETEARVTELKNVRDRRQADYQNSEFIRRQKQADRDSAFAASEKIRLVEADYKIHVSTLTELKNLEIRRTERDKLKTELAKIENDIVRLQSEQKSCGESLKKSTEARAKIVELQPKAQAQEEFEKSREALRTDSANARAAENQVGSYEDRLKRLRNNLSEINEKIKAAEEKSANGASFETLQKRDTEITRELAKLRAVLERDEQFEREVIENLVRNHFCPIVSQKCLNLETGKASENQIESKNGDGKAQIAALETEQKSVSAGLARAREAEKNSAVLPALLQQKSKITEEGTHIRREQENWKKQAENLSKIKTDLMEIETKLNALENPKAKLLAFEIEAGREDELKEKLSENEKKLQNSETEKSNLGEQLSKFAALDAEWKSLSGERERTAAAHREFLASETLAQSLSAREIELDKALQENLQLKAKLEKAAAEFEKANQTYDRQRHLTEKAALLETEKRLAETRATLEAAKKRESELSAELEKLKAIRAAMHLEFQEKERLEKVLETTEFIRETLKEAAPHVARNYVFRVSHEANQLYREITGNAERTLKWTEDYGIALEENGYDRPFINLSGGEQMAAALSVRLALLKQLSDVRLAFFDEPTANMDAARRERLAEQISHITERKTFDQLFVISHDDTFEGYVDHVISVGVADNYSKLQEVAES